MMLAGPGIGLRSPGAASSPDLFPAVLSFNWFTQFDNGVIKRRNPYHVVGSYRQSTGGCGLNQIWLARARSQTRAYVKEWPSNWDPDLEHEGGLQLMNALQWLEGYGGHERFHHRQIDSLITWCNGNNAIQDRTSA
jgi:hypothetical protein